jgi:hypothetical protein
MNLLASGGHTSAGGGTSLSAICNAAYLVVGDAGGRVIRGSLGVRIKDVSPYIDKGQPVIWALFSSGEFNQRANERMEARKGVSDWSAWNQEILQPARKASLQLPKEVDPHVCLIIGYNLQTGEVAISDSWGAAYQERWMTQEEVIAVSQGETSVIGW